MASLGVILARRSSKRLPQKNLLPIGNLPLVGWMARAAAASKLDRLVVSTEDEEIATACEANGVPAPFRRPAGLAADYASSPDIIGNAIDRMNEIDRTDYDIAVLLQPTTPFVATDHIDTCLDALEDPGINCAFTVRQADDPPQWMFRFDGSRRAVPLLGQPIDGDQEHSQNLDVTFVPNGAAYTFRVAVMRAQNRIICDPATMIVMDKPRSVDIDDGVDLAFARILAETYKFEPVPLISRQDGGH